ncbi:MAG: iron donor protein CyaY [Planctomycetota bacterium]
MNTAPRDPDFHTRSEQYLASLQRALDTFDPDELEADLSSGVLRINLPGRRTCILNRQAAASQIWMAEGASAWHFAFDEVASAWLDTKGRGELRQILGQVLSERLGRPVTV